MIKSNIIKSLEELNEKDIYSLILFALYKLKDCKEYSTLSELIYLLDKESLFNFLSYYGGLTIRIPTLQELKQVVYALIVYQYVDIDGGDLTNTLRSLRNDDVLESDIKDAYYKLREVMTKYDFKRNDKK